MKKPLPVKIVEALGWTYVALLTAANIVPICLSLQGGQGENWWFGVFVVLALDLSFIGMVLELHRGWRTWFVCQNSFLCSLGVADMVFHGGSRNSDVVGVVSLVLLIGPIVLLYCRQSRQWFAEMAAKSRRRHYGLVCALCVIVFLCIIVFVIPNVLPASLRRGNREEPVPGSVSEEDLRFQQSWDEELRKAREAQSEWYRTMRAPEPMPRASVPESYKP